MTWFWKSIGVGEDFLTHWDETRLAFRQEWAVWVGVVLLPLLAVYIHWRQKHSLRTAPSLLRGVLTALRVLILALLFFVLSGPYLKRVEQVEKRPIVAFLFDHSQSMQLEAGPFDPDTEARVAKAAGYRVLEGTRGQPEVDSDTRRALDRISRGQLVHAVVQANAAALLDPLRRKYDVQYYSVAEDTRPVTVATENGQVVLPEPPRPRERWGTSTHLGDAIQHVLTEAAGRPVSGIVVFTDGQNTGGRSLAEAARAAHAAGTPIFSVPAGTATRLRDVAVVDVFTTDLVSVGDTARVVVTIESQGFDKRPVKVELYEGKEKLDSKDLVLRGREQQQVELTFQAKQPGAHFLTVQVPPQPEEPESLRGNNSDSAFVRVTEEKLKVLYVEGWPRWDFRFLKNAMRRDHGLGGRSAKEPDIVLEAEWRRLPPERRHSALPRSLDELAQYHTVILGDVSPAVIDSEFLDLLVKAVREKGLGLIVEAGPENMPTRYDQRLLDLLPVRGLRGAFRDKPFTLELSPSGAVHEAMRFYDDPLRNENAWTHMPPFYWCLAAERPAPAATVLAWNGTVPPGDYGKWPLIAHHYAGQGRVLLVGTDSTWLWRQNVGDRYFYKFWGQAIRFVARREQGAQKKSWMDVRPLRAQPGETASVELMAYTADGTPRSDTTVNVQVADDKGMHSLALTADRDVKGRYTGTFPLERAGEYRVVYNPDGQPIEAKVRVTPNREEMRHPNVNRKALERLAQTSAHGQMVELWDVGQIPERLKGETKRGQVPLERDVWDNWLVLCVLILLYSFDVGLRRLAGLS
jgi:hypothetical protein